MYAAARFGQLREDHDANLTWEGDNNVLIQQAGMYLLSMYQKRARDSPLHSLDYVGTFDFTQFDTRMQTVRSANIAKQFKSANILSDETDRYFLVQTMQHVVCYLLWKYARKVDSLVHTGQNKEEAKLHSQAFYCKNLGIAYIEVRTLYITYACTYVCTYIHMYVCTQ
jgi:acyl-CoA oxidase